MSTRNAPYLNVCVFHRADESTEVCVGWSMYPLFHQQQSQTSQMMKAVGENSPKKPQSISVRLAVYEGTPRVLFTLKHPTQGMYTQEWFVTARAGKYSRESVIQTNQLSERNKLSKHKKSNSST